MIQLVRSFFGITPDGDAVQVGIAPQHQNEIPAHDPFLSMLAEQVRQQDQWLESVAASNAAQQAFETAIHDSSIPNP